MPNVRLEIGKAGEGTLGSDYSRSTRQQDDLSNQSTPREVVTQNYEKCSIFRAPSTMTSENQSSFEPLVVSIGPYHREKQARLAIQDNEKREFALELLRSLEDHGLVENMKPLISRARNCYMEKFDKISEDDFAKMMVLDGCFIIQFLSLVSNDSSGKRLPSHEQVQIPNNPIIKEARWMVPSVRLDLIKLENQIPFFVLQHLHDSLNRLRVRPLPPIDELAIDFLRPLMPSPRNPKQYGPEKRVHLLSLLHILVHPEDEESNIPMLHLGKRKSQVDKKFKFTCKDSLCQMHSAVSAYRIWSRGIQLKNKNGSPMDVTYRNGVLEVPCFTIHQNTKHLLRNLVAYEQGNRKLEFHTMNFVTFMNGLIDTSSDVAFLRHKGIINHALGSDEEVMDLINNLNKGVPHYEEDCFLCHLGHIIEPNFVKFVRAVRAVMSLFEVIVYDTMHPRSFVTAFLAILALYVSITQTVLTVFSNK